MTYPRLIALGPIMLGEPYHPTQNPILFNLVYPGHPQHGSSICLEGYLPVMARERICEAVVCL